ncbi:hypothetical protein evm_009965 [Chilo suppressalis]|nr:hypothetical protein evm_009965 [Chilo suppressalis]
MVRSLSQWTKTLSFPARLSPNRTSKESVSPSSPGVSPTPSASSLPQGSEKTISPIPITEISQIIYPDPESEKAIMGSVVYCIHHKQGCQWSDELRKLKAHLNTCKHDAVLCAAQCGAMIPRVLMQDHLRYTCPRRRANCDHCHKEFSGSALEEHQGNCGHEPVYCENKCGAKVQRRHTQQHLQQHCSKRLVPCRHCGQRYTQPINVLTAGAQAFPMDGIGTLGHEPPRGSSVDWRVLTTADAAGTNGLTCLPKHEGELEIEDFWSPIQ